MPAFIAALLGGLVNLTGSIVGRVMIALGISVVTYSGFSTTLDWLKSQAVASLAGMGAETVAMLSYMKVGVALSIVFSAVVARFTLNGLAGGTMKRWILK